MENAVERIEIFSKKNVFVGDSIDSVMQKRASSMFNTFLNNKENRDQI